MGLFFLNWAYSRAEVIKIENPNSGDDTRGWGPPFAKALPEFQTSDYRGESAYFLAVAPRNCKLTWQVNRNKKSVALNFKHSESLDVLKRIIESSDVLVENYIPGTLKKYGLDYQTLSHRKPDLIYASITGTSPLGVLNNVGYGQTGPYAQRAGYDVMVEAEMGLMHITGSPSSYT